MRAKGRTGLDLEERDVKVISIWKSRKGASWIEGAVKIGLSSEICHYAVLSLPSTLTCTLYLPIVDEPVAVLVGHPEQVRHLVLGKLISDGRDLVTQLVRTDKPVAIPVKNTAMGFTYNMRTYSGLWVDTMTYLTQFHNLINL